MSSNALAPPSTNASTPPPAMEHANIDQWFADPDNWDWVEKAMAWDDTQDSPLDASEDATSVAYPRQTQFRNVREPPHDAILLAGNVQPAPGAGNLPNETFGELSHKQMLALPYPYTASTPTEIISCTTIRSIPSGKAAGKVLKCGVIGCTSTKLFDRKYELQRHMETHGKGRFPCTVPDCDRGEAQPFKRREHLRNHERKIHGF